MTFVGASHASHVSYCISAPYSLSLSLCLPLQVSAAEVEHRAALARIEIAESKAAVEQALSGRYSAETKAAVEALAKAAERHAQDITAVRGECARLLQDKAEAEQALLVLEREYKGALARHAADRDRAESLAADRGEDLSDLKELLRLAVASERRALEGYAAAQSALDAANMEAEARARGAEAAALRVVELSEAHKELAVWKTRLDAVFFDLCKSLTPLSHSLNSIRPSSHGSAHPQDTKLKLATAEAANAASSGLLRDLSSQLQHARDLLAATAQHEARVAAAEAKAAAAEAAAEELRGQHRLKETLLHDHTSTLINQTAAMHKQQLRVEALEKEQAQWAAQRDKMEQDLEDVSHQAIEHKERAEFVRCLN